MILDQHNLSNQLNPPFEQSGSQLSQIAEQVQSLLAIPELRIRCRIRGNHLLVLCESQVCPDKNRIIPVLIEQLPTFLPEGRLRADATPIYQVIVYGRSLGQTQPQWTEPFLLHPAHPSLSDTPVAASSGQATVLALAQQGTPLSIARHLSQRFSSLGISVRVRRDEAHHCLLVACESGYVPDASVLATPLAQSLRELGLKELRYALVFAQVSGEAKPEWILRVDLTPPEKILRAWARWGDVQSVSRLLNQVLHPQDIQVSTILKDSTLHLSCSGLQQTTPDRLTAIAAITPLLDSLTLQGIHAVTIYGFTGIDQGLGQDTGQTLEQWPDPVWVHWHDLPVASQPELLPTTFELAHQGNLEAITFLLTRQLNPNLDSTLETGGIRVQVHQQNDLLHVMTDAPNCPDQQSVSQAIARLVKGLSLDSITGVRVYGRRSGQKQPLWHYGVDFAARHRLVPEAAPEFAASDAYVGDLLTQSSAIVPWSDSDLRAEQSTVRQRIASLLLSLQQGLIWTRLFLPESGDSLSTAPLAETEPSGIEGKGKVIAWGLLGLLMVVQADWILGQWTQPEALQPQVAAVPTPVASEPTAAKLPELSLQKRKLDNRDVFNDSGFTQPGAAAPLALEELPPVASQSGEPQSALAMLSPDGKTARPLGVTALPASPLQPKAAIASVQSPAPFPTFNSRQFDRQLLAYQDYVAMHGAPDVLIVGSSRALRGVDPVALNTTLQIQGHPDLKIFNLSVNGATAQVINLLLQRILPPDKLPKVVIWADGARAFNGGRLDITYNGLIASKGFQAVQSGKLPIPSASFTPLSAATADDLQRSAATSLAQLIPASYQTLNQDLNQFLSTISMAYHQRDRLKSVLRDSWLSLLTGKSRSEQQADGGNPQAALEAMVANGQSIDIHGFLPVSIRFNPATYYQKYARVPGDYDTDYRNFTLAGHQTEALKSLAKFMQQRQISLVFVNLPLTKDYLDPTRRRHEEEFRQYLTRLTPQLGVLFRDLALQSSLTRPDYFSDPSHLNRYGAFAVSRQLAQDSMIPWQQGKP